MMAKENLRRSLTRTAKSVRWTPNPLAPPPEPHPVHDSPGRKVLYAAWAQLDNAICGIETAQPFQMTEAAAKLTGARQVFDATMRALMMEK